MHALDHGAVTDRGVLRRLNEDSILTAPPVFVVADGVGGSDAGEMASAIVVEEFGWLAYPESSATRAEFITPEQVRDALSAAHLRVLTLSNQCSNGAGSTAVGAVGVMVGQEPYWVVFNVGDSRIYRLPPARSGQPRTPDRATGAGQTHRARLHQVSVDHSHVQELIEAGVISRDEAAHHPGRNLVTRAIGSGEGFEPEFWMLPMVPGDRLLLCSDGLTGELAAATIDEVVSAGWPPQETAAELLRLTLEAGAQDNVSAIVVDVAGSGGHAQAPTSRAAASASRAGSAVGSAKIEQVLHGRTGDEATDDR